jgi:hypothetical protein
MTISAGGRRMADMSPAQRGLVRGARKAAEVERRVQAQANAAAWRLTATAEELAELRRLSRDPRIIHSI